MGRPNFFFGRSRRERRRETGSLIERASVERRASRIRVRGGKDRRGWWVGWLDPALGSDERKGNRERKGGRPVGVGRSVESGKTT